MPAFVKISAALALGTAAAHPVPSRSSVLRTVMVPCRPRVSRRVVDEVFGRQPPLISGRPSGGRCPGRNMLCAVCVMLYANEELRTDQDDRLVFAVGREVVRLVRRPEQHISRGKNRGNRQGTSGSPIGAVHFASDTGASPRVQWISTLTAATSAECSQPAAIKRESA